ncbi:MAG: hypothetical protein JSS49_02700 [Planctomycetes bacterium]|nr:hypothetical protein [Planctomycetota bacterium]
MSPTKTLTRQQICGVIGIAIGFGITMGGTMFLFVTLLQKNREFVLVGMVQIFLGLLGVLAGALLFRQHKIGKYIAGVVIAGVAANMMFLLVLAAQKIHRSHAVHTVGPDVPKR